jgi:hypothetical protein
MQEQASHVRESAAESFSASQAAFQAKFLHLCGQNSLSGTLSITVKIIAQRREVDLGFYFESSQSCRDIAACFRILAIRLAPISSSRCELGMMMDISPLAMTSCLDPG